MDPAICEIIRLDISLTQIRIGDPLDLDGRAPGGLNTTREATSWDEDGRDVVITVVFYPSSLGADRGVVGHNLQLDAKGLVLHLNGEPADAALHAASAQVRVQAVPDGLPFAGFISSDLHLVGLAVRG